MTNLKRLVSIQQKSTVTDKTSHGTPTQSIETCTFKLAKINVTSLFSILNTFDDQYTNTPVVCCVFYSVPEKYKTHT